MKYNCLKSAGTYVYLRAVCGFVCVEAMFALGEGFISL